MTGPLGGRRIAYLSDQELPNTVATSEQVVNTVAALGARGASVELVIPRVRGVDDAKLRRFYRIGDTFTVRRLPRLPGRGPGKLGHGVLGPLSLDRAARPVVYTRNVLPAVLAARVLRLPVVLETYHVLDRSRPRTARTVAALSRATGFLGIVAHSELARDGLVRAGVGAAKVAVHRNGFNPRLFAPPLSREQARAELGWDPKQTVACYTGRVDLDKGAGALFELAARTPEVRYALVGPTERRPLDWVARHARACGLGNVEWYPPVPTAGLAPYLFAADVLLIPPTAGPLERHGRTVLPLKTYLYMAAGRPILAPRLGDTAGLLDDDNAVLVAADEPDRAAAALRRLVADPERSARLGAAARRDVEAYTWEARAGRIIAWLEERLRR